MKTLFYMGILLSPLASYCMDNSTTKPITLTVTSDNRGYAQVKLDTPIALFDTENPTGCYAYWALIMASGLHASINKKTPMAGKEIKYLEMILSANTKRLMDELINIKSDVLIPLTTSEWLVATLTTRYQKTVKIWQRSGDGSITANANDSNSSQPLLANDSFVQRGNTVYTLFHNLQNNEPAELQNLLDLLPS